MTRTLFGIERRTIRRAGWAAFVVLVAMIIFVEPWLQAQGYGVVALAVYAALFPAFVWSIAEDVRSWRATTGDTNRD